MYDTYDEEHENVARLNKTQQKREIAELHDLAKSLSRLDAVALEKMDLPKELFQALIDVQSMKHGAEKRQFKFIVKLLRQIETESFMETIAELDAKKSEQDKNFHRTERWRDRLISEGHDALTEFMGLYPLADSGQIRQLVRNANKEALENKPHKSSRALFRLLRDIICQ
ncbi:ribosome-associated protein [Mariprofundus ferrinatatus]|uniref:Dual-action ribosomal maturation protein DarP n=1 Tax=Mariprofundus ferrinatatus TaxID=1921087 RepID=A0A2K8L2N9_9PROT|nr:ribosome biogenesis factor YjgA [Mariprofundus ferrinatatus]ATX81588.1 ribosome-associated protein [Mariprofundus ferrinatatus]